MSTATISPSAYQQIDVLLIDDDEDDVRLTRKSLEKDRVLNHIHHARDGVEAMRFLRQEAPFEDAPRPDLILFDLNMPRKDGREVLREIKADPQLCCIPIVILTTSEDELDILDSYNNHANSYVTKPVDLVQFRSVVTSLKEFWFTVVKLPNAGH